MSAAAPHLRVVEPDAATGEVVEREVSFEDRARELAAENAKQKAIIKGLERDINRWRWRYDELERDRDVEARGSPLWPVAELLFMAWQKHCDHPKSVWTEDRFWQCLPFLDQRRWGPTLEARVMRCATAIKGAAFDHYQSERRNGTVKHHNDWEQIFHRRDGKQKARGFEEFVQAAPVGWVPVLSPGLREAIGVAEERLERMREAAKG